MLGSAPRPGQEQRGIILLLQISKTLTPLSAILAKKGARIDPEGVILKPRLLLARSPRKLSPSPFTLKVSIDIPVARAN